MRRRKWKTEQKALTVLERLKGRPIGELCAEHENSQAQYYQWRDQFLANAAKAFEPAGAPQRQGRLERENARLKVLVGEPVHQSGDAQRPAALVHPGAQGRAPVLGLPADLGVSALCRWPRAVNHKRIYP